MATLKQMRAELINAHREGLSNDVRLISEIDNAPRDATEVVICYLALEAARGSHKALVACEAIKEWLKGGDVK